MSHTPYVLPRIELRGEPFDAPINLAALFRDVQQVRASRTVSGSVSGNR